MIKVFISYSSENRVEKEELVAFLKSLESEDSTGSVKVDAWDDSKIGIGEEWEQQIFDALQEAEIAILLVTTSFLNSDFIRKKELIQILERHEKKNLIVVPVIARHCAWRQASWLSKLEVFSKGQVLWDGNRDNIEERLTALTDEVANCAKRLSSTLHPSPSQPVTAGTNADQKPHGHIQVLDLTTIPKSIPALRETKFTLKFHSDIPYSRIHFAVEDNRTTIHIAQSNSKGKASDFEFDFAQGENREQTFTLLADNPPDNSLFRLKAACFDETGELMAVPVDRLIRLYRQPPPPKDLKDVFGAAIWFWFWFRFSQSYVKVALPAVLLGIFLVIVYFVVFPRVRAYFNPPPYFTKVKDDFLLSGFPWSDKWEVKSGTLDKANGDSGGDDGALLFTGPGQIFAKGIAPMAFYDFDLHFRLWFKLPTVKFGWIVRAQPDETRGYAFFLERDQSKHLLLVGRVYEGPNKYQLIDNIRRQVNIADCCDASDRFDVDMEVRGNQITCKVKASNFKNPSINRGLANPYPLDRFDLGSSPLYPYGNVGLFQQGGESVGIDEWTITPITLNSVGRANNSPN